MNKIHGFNIDMLRLCFEVEQPELFDHISTFDVGEKMEFYEFYLLRIEGKYFEYVFQIRYDDLGEDKLFGELKFGLNKNDVDANTHTNEKRKAWISVSNRVLYTKDEFYCLDYIADTLFLTLHNITTIDLALDMTMNISNYLKKLIRCKDNVVILNGKKIKDRKEDRPEITYTMSGNLDRCKYLTLNIKQKKAIKDKSKGLTLTAYDKKAEIVNSSEKGYITELYGQPKRLYRLEVHLNNDEIKDYLNKTGEEMNFGTLYNENFLFRLFYSTLETIIRFERNSKKVEWEDVLEGDITTTPTKGYKSAKSPLQQAS